MNAQQRNRWRLIFLVALIGAAILSIWLVVMFRGSSGQQAAVDAMRRRGGIVVLGSSGKYGVPPPVTSIDLSSAVVDTELMKTLGQFTEVERLSLDGAKMQPQDWTLLGKLRKLRSLSLSRSKVSDTDISQLLPALTSLVLSGTSVTDKSMSVVAGMSGLTSLDITDTAITPEGLRLLEPLRSLTMLRIDDKCVAAESAKSLQRMQPQNVEVVVSEGMGQKAWEWLSVCKGLNIRGLHREGYVLWEVGTAWCDTLAGVVEAVVAEMGLDPQQASRLLRLLGTQPLGEWASIVPGPLAPTSLISYSTTLPDNGKELASAASFIRELQKEVSGSDMFAIRRFAREKFAASDLPQLLAAMREELRSNSSRGTWLFYCGPFLLVQHGMDDSEVVAELDHLLAHESPLVREATICAFGYGGASWFYARDEWAASATADAWAVPRFLRICKDRGELGSVRNCARHLLTEIALGRPTYAADLMPVLVDLLDEEGPWERQWGDHRDISSVDITRLAEVDVEAAIAVVPRLREMLRRLDEQLADAPATIKLPNSQHISLLLRRFMVLDALSATAHYSPELAEELALEYLRRIEDGLPAGRFATLLSPDTPKANRTVLMTLLNSKSVTAGPGLVGRPPPDCDGADAHAQLVYLAKKIRDWKVIAEGKKDE